MTTYEDAPWLSQYRDGTPPTTDPPPSTMIDIIDEAVATGPDGAAIHYFDNSITYRELDEAADAYACSLIDAGVTAGDRVALYLQNEPSFVIGLIGIWRVGGIAVTINPMNKSREVIELLTDSGTTALLCLDTLYDSVVTEAMSGPDAPELSMIVVTGTNDLRAQLPNLPARQCDPSNAVPPRLVELIARNRGRRPPRYRPQPGDPAVLVYTSAPLAGRRLQSTPTAVCRSTHTPTASGSTSTITT